MIMPSLNAERKVKENYFCITDCYYNGKKYAYGEKYPKDACNYCTCGYGGIFTCTADTCYGCELITERMTSSFTSMLRWRQMIKGVTFQLKISSKQSLIFN